MNAASAKRKQKQFLLQDKLNILQEIDAGRKQIGPLQTAWHCPIDRHDHFERLRQVCQTSPVVATCSYEEMAVTVKLSKCGPSCSHVVQRYQTANSCLAQCSKKKLANSDALEITGFDASVGLLCFCQRNGITWQTDLGEKKVADREGADSWRYDSFREEAESYSEDDVFSAEETTCFYQLPPDSMIHFKGQQGNGRKKSHLHVTVLLCCNATGTKKIKPLIIGKYAKPPCMKKCHVGTVRLLCEQVCQDDQRIVFRVTHQTRRPNG